MCCLGRHAQTLAQAETSLAQPSKLCPGRRGEEPLVTAMRAQLTAHRKLAKSEAYSTTQLTMVGFNGEYFDTLSFELFADARELVEVLARRLSANPATLALSQETNPLRAHLPLYVQGISAATTLTVTRLVEPREHDGVQQCDSCRFIRFCHYGYSAAIRESSIIGYEAVIALCEPCGGSHAPPSEFEATESEPSDQEEDSDLPRAAEMHDGSLSDLGEDEPITPGTVPRSL
jgi:hypothetical protein